MRIQVNGEDKVLNGTITVAALVASLALDTRKVAIERNAEIVPRAEYAQVPLAEGDRIEIVQFIGGG
jgi:thiamine biosynthesis protein ThiS